MRWRFSDYVLDLDRRELFHGESAVHISPKAFQLLQCLIEKQPKALSKEELYETLWPGTFVSESNLPGLIRELRAALNDRETEHGLIRTVHRYGYAFAGQASPVQNEPVFSAPRSRCRLVLRDREWTLPEGETLLGRDPQAAIWIDDATVSRHHARIRISGSSATIEDLDSKNGTYVSEQKVNGSLTLSDGDQLMLGSVEMTFRSSAADQSTLSIPDRADRPIDD